MSKLFTISDTHFNSENIIKYCNRPFTDSAHQNAELIHRWNDTISPEDTIIVTGDFILGLADTIPEILEKLNGHIILVRGNHDTKRKLEEYKKFPDKIIVKDIHYEEFGGLFFVFCHFPLTSPELLRMIKEDNSEIVLIHGHLHDKGGFFNRELHSFNVSVEQIQYRPISLQKLFHLIKEDFQNKGVWK